MHDTASGKLAALRYCILLEGERFDSRCASLTHERWRLHRWRASIGRLVRGSSSRAHVRRASGRTHRRHVPRWSASVVNPAGVGTSTMAALQPTPCVDVRSTTIRPPRGFLATWKAPNGAQGVSRLEPKRSRASVCVRRARPSACTSAPRAVRHRDACREETDRTAACRLARELPSGTCSVPGQGSRGTVQMVVGNPDPERLPKHARPAYRFEAKTGCRVSLSLGPPDPWATCTSTFCCPQRRKVVETCASCMPIRAVLELQGDADLEERSGEEPATLPGAWEGEVVLHVSALAGACAVRPVRVRGKRVPRARYSRYLKVGK